MNYTKEQLELLEEAKRMFPIGTEFINKATGQTSRFRVCEVRFRDNGDLDNFGSGGLIWSQFFGWSIPLGNLTGADYELY